MYTPRNYFTSATEQRRALEALGDFFQAAELDLYDASVRAFPPLAVAAAANEVGTLAQSASVDEAYRCFWRIYDELVSNRAPSYWNVCRPSGPAKCWRPQKIFETIKGQFAEYPWDGKINLTSFGEAEAPRLQLRLETMQDIKRNQGYPIMIVSKFLHFYNPALFPIYDTGVIYNKVLKGYWRSDFRDFCTDKGLRYGVFMERDTIDFLPAYMLWASSLLSAAHGSFMQVFTDWLAEQPVADLSRRKFDATTLYARAFEYTAVGAAKAEGW
jgi:hypothetical protein